MTPKTNQCPDCCEVFGSGVFASANLLRHRQVCPVGQLLRAEEAEARDEASRKAAWDQVHSTINEPGVFSEAQIQALKAMIRNLQEVLGE